METEFVNDDFEMPLRAVHVHHLFSFLHLLPLIMNMITKM